MFEPDTKSIKHKHTLSLQRRMNKNDTKRFITVLVVEPQV